MTVWKRAGGLIAVLALTTAACAATPAASTRTQAPSTSGAATQQPPAATATTAPQASSTARPSSAGMVELKMWGPTNGDAYDQWWDDYIAAFNASHPNIHVTIETFEGTAYLQKIRASLNEGGAPDIFYMIPGGASDTYFREGKMVPMENYMDASSFTPATTAACSVDGTLACMPMYLAPSFVYYNKDMFAEADVDTSAWADPMRPTWDEFKAAADALKTAGDTPIALGNLENWEGMFWYWAFQNRYGGVQTLKDSFAGTESWSGPSYVKAGELVQELKPAGYLNTGFNGVTGDAANSLFTQGQAAMIFMGPWLVSTIKTEEGPENWGFFNFPTFADGDADAQTDVMAGVDGQWIAKTSAHPDEAGEFLKGFIDPATALDFMIKTDSISSVNGIIPQAGDQTPIVQVWEAATGAAHAYPWWDQALVPKISDAMMSQSQALLDGGVTPEAFAQGMDDAAD